MEFVYEEDNFLPREICEKLIQKFENDPDKTQGRTVLGVNLNIKKTTDLIISGKNWIKELNYIQHKVNEAISNYKSFLYDQGFNKCNRLSELFHKTFLTPPKIQKAGPGGFYRWHHDATDCNSRIFTYIVYLNDVDEDCGGTTDFKNGKRIQPKTGKLMIFPTTWTYLHRGKKVEKGDKYILTSFVYGVPPYAENRT